MLRCFLPLLKIEYEECTVNSLYSPLQEQSPSNATSLAMMQEPQEVVEETVTIEEDPGTQRRWRTLGSASGTSSRVIALPSATIEEIGEAS